MKRISRSDLRQLAESVGEREGWDFSCVRDERDPIPWRYMDLVRQYLQPTDRVLDIGSGGGETFLSLAKQMKAGVGIDIDAEMVATAINNKIRLNINNVSFKVMDAKQLDFDPSSFDIVLNRQSVYVVEECVRVLKPGGTFITQQVGPRNTQGVYQIFGWNQDHFDSAGTRTTESAEEFRQQGCHIRAIAEYDVPYRFLDVASFIFWLKAVPLPEKFDPERHWKAVNHLLEKYGSDRGIELNEHRELLIVQKEG